MKKQILFLAAGLLINANAQCMEEDSKNNQLCPPKVANAVSDYLEKAKEGLEPELGARNDQTGSFFDRHLKALQTEESRIDKLSEQEAESSPRNDRSLDPIAILEPFNRETQSLTACIQDCWTASLEASAFFNATHMKLEDQTNKVYNQYLAERRKAKICISSPSYNTLALRAQRFVDEIRSRGMTSTLSQRTLHDTLAGLLESLKETKESVNKK